MPLSPGINHSRLDANSDPISQFYMGVGKESIESQLSCLRPLLPFTGIPLPALGGVNGRWEQMTVSSQHLAFLWSWGKSSFRGRTGQGGHRAFQK